MLGNSDSRRARISNSSAALVLIATVVFYGGCAGGNSQNSAAKYPEFKSGKSVLGSSRKPTTQEKPSILPQTYYAAGRVLEQQRSLEQAMEQYRKAIAANPDYTAAHARLGLMLSLTGQHEEAVSAFNRAVELKPDSAALQNNLGFELLFVERWASAERHLREAVRLDPTLGQAHMNLGLLLWRTDRPQQAVESFQRVLPEPDAYYNLGLLQRSQGRYTDAAETFRHVLALNPKFTAADQQLGLMDEKMVAANSPIMVVTTNAPLMLDDGIQDPKRPGETTDYP